MILFDGSETLQLGEHAEKAVPRGITIQNDCRLGTEVGIQSLIPHKDRDGFEHVLQAWLGREEKGVGFNDFSLDVSQRDALIPVGIENVPSCTKQEGQEIGSKFASGVLVVKYSSGKSNNGHGFRVLFGGGDESQQSHI